MKLCDIKRNNPYIFNSWRGILYTEKGKRVGTSEEWKDFLTFFNSVEEIIFGKLKIRKRPTINVASLSTEGIQKIMLFHVV